MSEKYIDFENYLRGDLTKKEELALDELLKNDKEANIEFEEYREMRTMLNHKINQEKRTEPLIATIQSFQGKYFKEETEKKAPAIFKLNRRLLSIAASVLVLFIAGVFVEDYAQTHYSNTSIAQSNQELMDLELTRSTGEQSTLPIASFLDKDYNETLEALKSISSESVDYPKACYLKAESYFALQEYDQAIEWNLVLSEFEDKKYRDYADWNLMNCYLMIDQREKANALLEKMSSDPEHNFTEKSKRTSKKLNGFMHWISSL